MKADYKRISVISHDFLMVSLAWAAAYLTRYQYSLSGVEIQAMLQALPAVLIVQGIVLWKVGLYRGVWRFSSVPDMWRIIRIVAIGTLAISLVLFLFTRLDGVPRSVLALYAVYLTLFLGVPRLIYRIYRDQKLQWSNISQRKRVLILGAGRAGEMLVREMRRDDGYLPVGFLDDNARLKGASVHGTQVMGDVDHLSNIVETLSVDLVMIAIPTATNSEMQRVVDLCEQLDIPFKTLPRLQDLSSDRTVLEALREVKLEDLLGRDAITLDWRRISKGLTGKTVLITGAGGSIGSELCRQVCRLGPAALILYERSEYHLYSIEMELRQEYPEFVLHACLGDVCDQATVDHVMKRCKPDVIFHAAAYKHVPILENQARQAIINNVSGTRTMARAASEWGCETFVMISTDKAVNPANVMGASKRAAEIYCQALNRRSKTHFITVRFGNVLGSAGSVVPLFKKQIAAGEPVTVTHPEITRYFMTIPEACRLIMEASVMGKGGEIFVLDMGEPVKISYLAEQLIILSGKKPGKDVKIIYTGLRPGEKLYEELFYEQENLSPTGHDKILLAQAKKVDWDWLNNEIDIMHIAAKDYEEKIMMNSLEQLVPEMHRVTGEKQPGNVINLKTAS
ncbi:MAG: polysaccharide biosynthesis protein [Gammaproteobacteria bacterium]|nr:polysaccharide biosynthesis protein [Gammaproteobacteria bacterium]